MCVVCACAGAGIAAALRMRDSEHLWRAWVTLLRRLYADLRYTAMPLQALLAAVDRTGLEPLGWLDEYTASDASPHLPQTIDKTEKAFAESFFAGLGVTDLDGQLAHIAWHIERAEEQVTAACEKYTARAKACTTSGICAGLCLGLLLW